MSKTAITSVRPEVRLFLAKEQRFFGPGPYRLLATIAKTPSLRVACKEMGLSYSKGWRIISDIEAQMGVKVVEKTRGGNQGGHTVLTPEGKQLIASYQAFTKECQRLVEKNFHKFFDGIGETADE